jgi:hypothetical protein
MEIDGASQVCVAIAYQSFLRRCSINCLRSFGSSDGTTRENARPTAASSARAVPCSMPIFAAAGSAMAPTTATTTACQTGMYQSPSRLDWLLLASFTNLVVWDSTALTISERSPAIRSNKVDVARESASTPGGESVETGADAFVASIISWAASSPASRICRETKTPA